MSFVGVFTVKKQGTKIVERINWFSCKTFWAFWNSILQPQNSTLDSRIFRESRFQVRVSSRDWHFTSYRYPPEVRFNYFCFSSIRPSWRKTRTKQEKKRKKTEVMSPISGLFDYNNTFIGRADLKIARRIVCLKFVRKRRSQWQNWLVFFFQVWLFVNRRYLYWLTFVC